MLKKLCYNINNFVTSKLYLIYNSAIDFNHSIILKLLELKSAESKFAILHLTK